MLSHAICLVYVNKRILLAVTGICEPLFWELERSQADFNDCLTVTSQSNWTHYFKPTHYPHLIFQQELQAI